MRMSVECHICYMHVCFAVGLWAATGSRSCPSSYRAVGMSAVHRHRIEPTPSCRPNPHLGNLLCARCIHPVGSGNPRILQISFCKWNVAIIKVSYFQKIITFNGSLKASGSAAPSFCSLWTHSVLKAGASCGLQTGPAFGRFVNHLKFIPAFPILPGTGFPMKCAYAWGCVSDKNWLGLWTRSFKCV